MEGLDISEEEKLCSLLSELGWWTQRRWTEEIKDLVEQRSFSFQESETRTSKSSRKSIVYGDGKLLICEYASYLNIKLY